MTAARQPSPTTPPPEPGMPLSADEELQLLKRYAPLVRHIAHRLHTMKPAFLERDDVLQDGMVGLLRAIRSNRGETSETQFAAYASTAIRGAIIDGYRQAGSISRGDYRSARQTRLEIAAGNPVSSDQRDHAATVYAHAWAPALPVDELSDDGQPLPDPAPGPEQRCIANQLLRRAIDALQRAAIRDRSIFIACELAGEAKQDIAQRAGLSPGRVSQIIGKVRQEVLLALA